MNPAIDARRSSSPLARRARIAARWLAAISLFAAPASAQYRFLSSHMDGVQAGTDSTWVAYGFCTVDTSTNRFEFSLFPLPTGTTELRLRGPALVGEIGEVLHTVPVATHHGQGVYEYAEDLEAAILSGLVYFEAPTAAFPTGEIRGQVFPTPDIACGCDSGAPCGNEDPDRGCANSTGVGAQIARSHVPSVSLDLFVMEALDVPAGQFGLLFTGRGMGGTPFGDGRRCVMGGVFRYPVRECLPGNVLCEGPGLVSWVASKNPSMAPKSGETWNYQFWFRDPAGPCGGGFNFSNALCVTWIP